MSNTAWLVIALAIVALALGAYITTLATRKRRVEKALAEGREDRGRAL